MDLTIVARDVAICAAEGEPAHLTVEGGGVFLLLAYERLVSFALQMLDQPPMPFAGRDAVDVDIESDRWLRVQHANVPESPKCRASGR